MHVVPQAAILEFSIFFVFTDPASPHVYFSDAKLGTDTVQYS